MTTQLTSPNGFNPSNQLILSELIEQKIPNSKLTYNRINISTRYPDGSTGPLIIPTQRVYSFGVCEYKDEATQKVNGYTLPLCLFNREGPTPEEKAWVDMFNNLCEYIKTYLVRHHADFGDEETNVRAYVSKLNPLYYKKDEKTKKPILGSAPTLYAKLITKGDKTGLQCVTLFNNQEDGSRIQYTDLLGKRCFATAAIKIESIYVSSDKRKFSLQVKVYQAVVSIVGDSVQSLLPCGGGVLPVGGGEGSRGALSAVVHSAPTSGAPRTAPPHSNFGTSNPMGGAPMGGAPMNDDDDVSVEDDDVNDLPAPPPPKPSTRSTPAPAPAPSGKKATK